MSGSDDEPAEQDAEEEPEEVTLADRLDAAESALTSEEDPVTAIETAIEELEAAVHVAETEADFDEIEAAVNDTAAQLEEADLPSPDDEDEEDPAESLASHIEEVEEAIETARGPYSEDVIELLDIAKADIEDTRWTTDGETTLLEAGQSAVSAVADIIDTPVDEPTDIDELIAALDSIATSIEAAELDPDTDASVIADLLETAESFRDEVEAAETWSDLSTREQLAAEGFYEVLDHRKDYPPEWHAIKEWEQRGNASMILLALEQLGMEYMEEHCLEALTRLGPTEALDPMLERAGRRDQPAIKILGKIGDEAAIETIIEYVGSDSNPGLEQVTLKALGEIGARDTTADVANRLAAENETTRSTAARALGLIGDPRAVEPLADTLESDESDTVRGSAAWALVQIGTESALEAVAPFEDDPSYLVQSEAERASSALGKVEA